MRWLDLEKAFGRALFLSFSKKKLALTFPCLILCGVLAVFCRAVAYETSDWIAMSFAFFPILLTAGVLLALGALLVRIHEREVKCLAIDLKSLLIASGDLLIGTASLAALPILAYLCLWMVLGLFFLLREIPLIGEFFSVIFSFAPFLLLFTSLLLCLFNLGLLFFVAPAAALQAKNRASLARAVREMLKNRPFTAFTLLLIAILPIAALAGLLAVAALLTDLSFSIAERSLSIALEWFFIMLPFCALLTPAVVFFFNFATESYFLLQTSLARSREEAPSSPCASQS